MTRIKKLSHEEMFPKTLQALRDARALLPKRGGWAPGSYSCKCSDCGREFDGDKRATQCSGCAYK